MAGTCPMTAELWRSLQEGRLTEGQLDVLLRHLDEDCPDCAKYFEEAGACVCEGNCDGADKEIYKSLLKGVEPEGVERNRMFGGIMDGVGASKRGIIARFAFTNPLRWYAMAPVALAVLVVAVVAFYLPGNGRYDGTKGADIDVPAINLQVAVLRGNGSSVPERGIPQETYRPGDTLIFRYELGANGYVYFLKADLQSVDLIDPANQSKPALQQKGVYEFREDGQALGYPLKRLKGQQVFIAVASKKPMNVHDELEPLVRSFIKGELPAKSPDWAIDSFRIAVEGRAAR